MPRQRRVSALGCRGRSPLAHQSQAGTDGRAGQARAPAIPGNDAIITSPVSSGRPSIAPIQKKTRATGVDGTSQRPAAKLASGLKTLAAFSRISFKACAIALQG